MVKMYQIVIGHKTSRRRTTNVRSASTGLLLALIALILVAWAVPTPVLAQTGAKQNPPGTPGASDDANQGTAATTETNYLKRNNWAKVFREFDRINARGESESGQGSVIQTRGPLYLWPEKHLDTTMQADLPSRRDQAIGAFQVKTFGLPVSDTQYQVIARLNDNMLLEEAFDPERWMWMETAMGQVKATSAANSAANLSRNQSQGAIEFAQQFLPNFTADAGNVWNRIRNELFVPMALLLLLPGAVLSQVRAIVAQGTGVLGDVNPFDGILRSIVAIFLIPATYLVVNYGIDVSNAISHEINNGYSRVFGGNMYEDAACAQRRAFPIRNPNQNKNAIPTTESAANQAPPAGTDQNPRAQLEAASFDIGASEQCGPNQGAQNQGAQGPLVGTFGSGGPQDYRTNRYRTQGDSFGSLVDGLTGQGGGSGVSVSGQGGGGGVSVGVNVGLGGQGANPAAQGVQQGLSGQGQQAQAGQDDGRADEEVPVLVTTQRLLLNAANAGLASTWNILCAFQMAYLYYLFCIGPVVAALWVWPMAQLRSALPSWAEGVVTLCFWSLFWNTTILLMAAFKGVDQTGTLIMTALNFLATASVKHAFDFAALVKDAGAQVAKEAEKAGKGQGGQGGAKQGDQSLDKDGITGDKDKKDSKDSKESKGSTDITSSQSDFRTKETPAAKTTATSQDNADAPQGLSSLMAAMGTGAYNFADSMLGGILPGGVEPPGSGGAGDKALVAPPPLADTADPSASGDRNAAAGMDIAKVGAGLVNMAEAMGAGFGTAAGATAIDPGLIAASGAAGDWLGFGGNTPNTSGGDIATANATNIPMGTDPAKNVTPSGNLDPGTSPRPAAPVDLTPQGDKQAPGQNTGTFGGWLEPGHNPFADLRDAILPGMGGPPLANQSKPSPFAPDGTLKGIVPGGSPDDKSIVPTGLSLPPLAVPGVDPAIQTSGPPAAVEPAPWQIQAKPLQPGPVTVTEGGARHGHVSHAPTAAVDAWSFYPTEVVQAATEAVEAATQVYLPGEPAPERREFHAPTADVHTLNVLTGPSYVSPGPGPGTSSRLGSVLAKAASPRPGYAASGDLNQSQPQSAIQRARQKFGGTLTGTSKGPTNPNRGV